MTVVQRTLIEKRRRKNIDPLPFGFGCLLVKARRNKLPQALNRKAESLIGFH